MLVRYPCKQIILRTTDGRPYIPCQSLRSFQYGIFF